MNPQIITIDIRFENDVVVARQKARMIAAALKFDKQDQTRSATAVSEVARNAFQYAGGGKVVFATETGAERAFVITVQDRGKGIPNLDKILSGKYESQTGMGKGMLGAYRLMDRFHVETKPDQGTTVTLAKTLPQNFDHFAPAAGVQMRFEFALRQIVKCREKAKQFPSNRRPAIRRDGRRGDVQLDAIAR